MTSDAFLGRACCCIPRRQFILLLALAFCSYGVVDAIYWILFRGILGDQPLTPHHTCSGHRCLQFLTCAGMRRSSYAWRKVCLTLGSAGFGAVGALGAAYRHPGELRVFGGFLFAVVVLLGVIVAYDGVYTATCGEYPFNVVNEALMWPVPQWPVQNGIKYEVVVHSEAYPVELVNRLTHLSVWWLYVFFELAAALFCWYAALVAFEMADTIRWGMAGMGPTFDMAGWHDVKLREQEAREELAQLMSGGLDAPARAAGPEGVAARQLMSGGLDAPDGRPARPGVSYTACGAYGAYGGTLAH